MKQHSIKTIIKAAVLATAAFFLLAMPLKGADEGLVHTTIAARFPHKPVLIARFSTLYPYETATHKARHHNIDRMCRLTDGVILLPGVEFSLNDHVGPRTDPTLWMPAPTILQGKLVDDLGGGICQFATTLYNCALMADVTVTERSPHSIPPAYVPIGQDAAIATGGADLKLYSTAKTPILISCFTADAAPRQKEVVVELYGSPLPYEITLKSSVIQELSPGEEPIVVEEPWQASPMRKGYEAELYAIYLDARGNEHHRRLIRRSIYPAAAERIYPGRDHTKVE